MIMILALHEEEVFGGCAFKLFLDTIVAFLMGTDNVSGHRGTVAIGRLFDPPCYLD